MVATIPILRRLRHSAVLPAIAMLSAVLLISGQILICCGLNESLSGSVTTLFRTLGVLEMAKSGAEDPARPHPTCHGHSAAAEPGLAFADIPGESGEPAFHPRETCLNELAFPVKVQASGPAAPDELLPAPKPESMVFVSLITPTLAGSSPSRNDTGPPVYLRTLRILL